MWPSVTVTSSLLVHHSSLHKNVPLLSYSSASVSDSNGRNYKWLISFCHDFGISLSPSQVASRQIGGRARTESVNNSLTLFCRSAVRLTSWCQSEAAMVSRRQRHRPSNFLILTFVKRHLLRRLWPDRGETLRCDKCCFCAVAFKKWPSKKHERSATKGQTFRSWNTTNVAERWCVLAWSVSQSTCLFLLELAVFQRTQTESWGHRVSQKPQRLSLI